MKKLCTTLFCVMFSFVAVRAQPQGKIELQGFYKDYGNTNFPHLWADYLAKLAPRLKGLHIDGVWIPPCYKNADVFAGMDQDQMGYAPFDHYDLGDKFQRGTTRTRVGGKNQLLRMIGIMHANGLGVEQDIVINHVIGAGSDTGAGGEDLDAPNDNKNDKFKNFRYVSYGSPATAETEQNYFSRSGRWPKNWPNFHPNPNHNSTADPLDANIWGPDICYGSDSAAADNGWGGSDNIDPPYFDPPQYNHYNYHEVRKWLLWFVRQTDADGFRWDAVKHYPAWVVGSLSKAVVHNNGEWNLPTTFFNTGEFFDTNEGLLDGFTNEANTAAGEDLVGTFDFSLRNGLLQMTQQDGGYDIAQLINLQQQNRNRTTTFVENHDTFEPELGPGNVYTGFGPNGIDPNDIRKQAAYALTFALDGNHMVFFEDLFVLNNASRLNHDPETVAVRDYLVNLMWCHQNLGFADGDYMVPHASSDFIVIEREGRALIGITDNEDFEQNLSVQTTFLAGTELHDYSGTYMANRFVAGDGTFQMSTPSCSNNVGFARKGYSVWAPANIETNYNLPAQRTTQAWEMADDLGDSHSSSLQQSGHIPSGIASRKAGTFYAQGGEEVVVDTYQQNLSAITITSVFRIAADGGVELIEESSGIGGSHLEFNAPSTAMYQVSVRKHSGNVAEDLWLPTKAVVKIDYMAPTELGADAMQVVEQPVEALDQASGHEPTLAIVREVFVSPNPASEYARINVQLNYATQMTLAVYDLEGNKLETLANGEFKQGLQSFVYKIDPRNGTVIYKLTAGREQYSGKILTTK